MRFGVALTVFSALVCTSCGEVASGTAKAVSRVAERRTTAVLERDLERDAASRAIQLKAPRRVFKYASETDASDIVEHGIKPGMHFTPSVAAGRPLTAAHAAERYGLGYAPDKRLTVTLPAGTTVKPNKVIGGDAGYGELRIEQQLPFEAVGKIIDVPSGDGNAPK